MPPFFIKHRREIVVVGRKGAPDGHDRLGKTEFFGCRGGRFGAGEISALSYSEKHFEMIFVGNEHIGLIKQRSKCL